MSRLLKNSTLYFFTDVSTKLASFVLLPFYTRLISPEEYGNIYLLISLSNFLTIFISLTLSSAISRYYFSCTSKMDTVAMYSGIVKFTFYFTTPIYLLLYILGPYIFGFVNLEFAPYIAISLLASYLSIYYLYISALLQARQDAKKLSFITICSSIVNLLFTFLLVVLMDDKVYAYLLSFLLTSAINFVIFIVFSRGYFSFRSRDKKLKEYLVYAGSRMPVDLSSWVVSFADRIMIYEIKGEKDTGLYSIGYKLGQVVQLFFMAVNRAYVPYTFEQFSKEGGPQKSTLDNIAFNALRLLSLYFFISFTAIVFSKEIVRLLDPSYQDSYLVMALILLSYLLLALKLLFQPPMDYKIEYIKIKSILWILTAVINIGLNILLIPKYSLNGAAFATFVSYLVILVPIIYYSNRAIPIKYDLSKILKIAFISSMYVLLFLLDVNIYTFLFKIIGTFVYLILLLKIGDVKTDDLVGILTSIRQKK